ncbi:hypothetical protein EYF80_004472 [Liparis tanakae]|uniref:Uncharacterized protein n=1 Tax=Liparis tanakae TaxID=230148 RepID=A0A4Z2J5K1_9TELE|nr:hypothetical protein EYF80_004472 [Liparis tanakae]
MCLCDGAVPEPGGLGPDAKELDAVAITLTEGIWEAELDLSSRLLVRSFSISLTSSFSFSSFFFFSSNSCHSLSMRAF